jgi:hypothetical protein
MQLHWRLWRWLASSLFDRLKLIVEPLRVNSVFNVGESGCSVQVNDEACRHEARTWYILFSFSCKTVWLAWFLV